MSSAKKSKPPRTRYMMADFTREEKNRILLHCVQNSTSISSFLAGIAMEDVRKGSRERTSEEEITITLKIPREQNAKLQMFARRQNKTPDQFCHDLLLPTLEKGKTSFTAKTAGLRYYLSPEEHRRLRAYLKSRKLSARTYISYLVLKALNRETKN